MESPLRGTLVTIQFSSVLIGCETLTAKELPTKTRTTYTIGVYRSLYIFNDNIEFIFEEVGIISVESLCSFSFIDNLNFLDVPKNFSGREPVLVSNSLRL